MKAIFKIDVIYSNMNGSDDSAMCVSNCLCLLDNLGIIIVIVVFFPLIMNCGCDGLLNNWIKE